MQIITPGKIHHSWLRRHRAGLFITFGFFLVSVLTLADYGQTLDEPETYEAAFRNLDIVKAVTSGRTIPSWTFHELPGYYFILDLLRGGFVWLISSRLHLMDVVSGFHLSHILLSTISVFPFYLVARNVSGLNRIAVLSTATLVLLPQFLGHSQNNPKDLPGLFVYVLAIYTFTRLDAASPLRDVLFAGLALGLALTTTVFGVFLIPLLTIWQGVRGKLRGGPFIFLLVTAAVAAFLFWPWLWSAPIANAKWAFKHVIRFQQRDLEVLYLGNLYSATDLPWHSSIVGFLTTTPVLYLLFAAVSVRALWSRTSATTERVQLKPDTTGIFGSSFSVEKWTPNPASAAVLGWLWFAIPMVAETHAPTRYDGVRHLLMMMPGFCLLVGVGLNSLLEWVEEIDVIKRSAHLRAAVGPACAAIIFVSVGVELVWIHPYHNAYLNQLTNSLIKDNAQDVFEVEYWGQSYKEGAEWVNAHVEDDAEIYVWVLSADHYLRQKSKELNEDTLPRFEDRTRPAYLMAMTRRGMYKGSIEHIVRNYDPVFTIRRQKAILLNIYSNRRPAEHQSH
jgi:Dolichyl-phosphate-mannose-protein mannosyltransferase